MLPCLVCNLLSPLHTLAIRLPRRRRAGYPKPDSDALRLYSSWLVHLLLLLWQRSCTCALGLGSKESQLCRQVRMVVCVAWERNWDFSYAHAPRNVSIKFANLTKRIWRLIRAPSLQTRHDQSANWSNPKVDLQTRRRICKFGPS